MSEAERAASAQLQKFVQFYRYLNGTYVDSLQNASLVETAITSMLGKLDPHSAYISAKEMKSVNDSFAGSFSGIGIEFNIHNDTLLVVNTTIGGPSDKVGVLPNDRIVEIDGVSCIGIAQADVPGKLRGPKGSEIDITVVRNGAREPFRFHIVRDNIPIKSVDAAYMLDGKTGYVKVNRFAGTTGAELSESLGKLGKIDALVLDLRGNGGGLLPQAIDVSSMFLKKGQTVVSTEGRMIGTESYPAKEDGLYTKERLVVLIDENSASASEIVSGAMQDWDRGLIVGRRSFGKGLVQRQMPLSDGSAVRITVARYHTPTGRVIQRPFEMGNKEAYYEAHHDRFDHRGADTLPGADSLKYKTLRLGRTVYGGGGIRPDVYAAADTTGFSMYWAKLARAGVMNEYVISYIAQNRDKLMAPYGDFDTFNASFVFDDQMIADMVALGQKRGVEPDEQGLARSKEKLALQAKGLFAQKLWTVNEFYRVVNVQDPVITRAKEVLSDKEWKKYMSR